MTRRKLPSQIVKRMPPNPANIARKLSRLKIEINAIADSIDRALDYLAREKQESGASDA